MKDSHYRSVVDHSPIGYAFNKLVTDKDGRPLGYSIVEANHEFEKITGLNVSALLGKNLYEDVPDLGDTGLDNLASYSEIALKGGSTVIERVSSQENKWILIEAFSEELNTFSTIISDITYKKTKVFCNDDLLNLSKTLLDFNGDNLDLNKLTGELCILAGSEVGVFNLYSADRKKFRNMAIWGKSKIIEAGHKLLGYSLYGKEWDASPTRIEEIRRGHMVRFNSIAELAKGVLPEKLCQVLSAALNIGSVYVIEISAHENIIGDFILVFRGGKEIQNSSSAAAFANMVGIAVTRKNEEKKRHASEKNLSNFFNAGIDFNWVLDEKGNITWVNDTVRKRLGYDDDELLGASVLLVHPPDQRAQAEANIKAILRGEDIKCHIPIIAKSGHSIPVETYVIRGEWNGEPSFFGISKDISELKLSEDKFYKAFNTSPDIMGLSTLDTGVFVEVNKAFCDILGYSPEEVIGRSSDEVLRSGTYLREKFYTKLKKNGFLRNEEVVVETKDGRPLNLLLSAEIITSHDREYNLTVAIDITSRKKMEESLRRSENQYRSLTEMMSDILWTCDLEMNTTWIGQSVERILGFTPGEMLNHKIYDRMTPESVRRSFDILARELEDDKNKDPDHKVTLIMDYFHKNGSLRVLENVMSFIRDKDGKPIGIHGLSRDVTERQKAEEELLGANEMLRETGLMAKVGAWEVNFIDGSVNWSDVTRKIMSVPDDFIPVLADILRFYKEGDSRERIYNYVERARATGEPFDDEFIAIAFDGKEHYIRNIARPVFKDGVCVKIVGTFQDITDKKASEIRLKNSEANLKAIIENTLENIWSVNTNYEIQYVNEVFSRAFQGTFGVGLKVGMNIISALPESLQGTWRERYDRAFRNEHFLFEDRIIVAGTHIYIEVAMNPIIIDEKIVGVAMYGRDVTEKTIAQIELQYQADLRKLLVELSSSFINLPLNMIEPAVSESLGRIGEFVGADRAYVFIYNFSGMTATNTLEWCREGIEKQIENFQNIPIKEYMSWAELHRKGESVKISNINEVKDKNLAKLLEMQNVKSLLTIPLMLQGECRGFVGFDSVSDYHNYTDIEHQLLMVYAQTLVNVNERIGKERKLVEAKEKAEESDRLKSAFLANMSHEIRTPMNGILGFLDLLKSPDLSLENKTTYIDIVNQSGHRLLDTLNDIIEISKIEANELKVHTSFTETEKLMQYFLTFFTPQAELKGIKLELHDHLKGDASRVRTDKPKLESMISNLLKNAVKFTNKGSISFGNFLKDDSIHFYVKDTGKGISADRLDIIFERFVQGDMSATRPHEGSGLGLSIVKAYAGMLGGKVWVESEIGKGSTFFFSLPYIRDDGKASEKKVKSTSKIQGKEGLAILVVEDDNAGYLYLEKVLSAENYTIVRRADGNEAVKYVRENSNLGLVLMDIKIPGISGIEATKMIRQFNKTIPIIAQTAYAFASDRLEALEAGCNEYISKPINRAELLKLISQHTGPATV